MGRNSNEVYSENGYESRSDYLEKLADEYGLTSYEVCSIADMFGPSEDFDGLPDALDQYLLTIRPY